MPDNQEPDLKETIKQVLQTLPPFLRTYITQGKYTPVAQGLMKKYGLRIDQGAVLERELLLLLMGIDNPTEFTQALLEEARIDQQTVNALTKDINDQVFLPLRKEEELQSKQVPAQSVAKPVQTPAPAPKPTMPAPPHIAPLPPKMAMPKSGSLGDIVRRITAPAAPDASRLLEDHEEPHIELKKPNAPVLTAPTAPVVSASKPVPAPEPVMPPVSALKSPMPEPAVKVTPPTPPAPPVPKAPLPPPVTSYEVDPYREPLDGK
jgi:hypothetical protein